MVSRIVELVRDNILHRRSRAITLKFSCGHEYTNRDPLPMSREQRSTAVYLAQVAGFECRRCNPKDWDAFSHPISYEELHLALPDGFWSELDRRERDEAYRRANRLYARPIAIRFKCGHTVTHPKPPRLTMRQRTVVTVVARACDCPACDPHTLAMPPIWEVFGSLPESFWEGKRRHHRRSA
jgi:hypothetical protein